jgi:hypothetical protein
VRIDVDCLSGPEVSGAARFEQDGGWRVLREELGELRPGESMTRDDAVLVIGDGEFEDILR